MKKTVLALSIISAAAILSLIACSESQKPESVAIISNDSLIKRGSYLVNAMGCDDCHSPKIFSAQGMEVDMEHRFSGHLANSHVGKADPSVMKNGWMLFSMGLTAYVGPWGTSFSANISSDETGIGNWSEAQFLNAIRNGKSKGLDEGRPLMPPMPWQMYRNLSDTDLKAIFAFLKTTKPVENRVPGPKPPNVL